MRVSISVRGIFLLSGGKDTVITTGSAMGSLVQVTNKRTKDTSGPGASPHIRLCRSVAKRLTPERPGRRLTYPNCDNCKTKNGLLINVTTTAHTDNCTAMPLSDSCNFQTSTECSTNGPRDQVIDVVGVSNLSQNSAEGRNCTWKYYMSHIQPYIDR